MTSLGGQKPYGDRWEVGEGRSEKSVRHVECCAGVYLSVGTA